VWDKLNTDSKTPHKTVYWLDKKTMLPVQAIMQNKEGEVLTVVEFLSIQTNPEFSYFDFIPEKEIVVFSDVTVEHEVEIITRKVPLTVGKIAKLTRFIRNPSTPSLINADRSKRVASNLANIKAGDFNKARSKNEISRKFVLLFMFISSFFALFPLYRKFFKTQKRSKPTEL
jgi:hypothetical protein